MAKSLGTKGANLFVYILIGLLILGLAGFGIGSFTSSTSAIGTVGKEEISVEDYYQQLQAEINLNARRTGQRLVPSQAIAFGLGQNALETLVLQAALDNEADKVGISVGDQTILEELSEMAQFSGVDGSFNRDAYDFALERSGITAAEFDQSIRDNETRTIIQTAVSDGIPPAKAYIDRLSNYYFSTRDVTWAMVPESMLEDDIPDPSEEDLRDYYVANEPQFTEPEVRHLTVAWITPDQLIDPDSIDEARVRELYNDREAEFSKPERRDLERLIFPDQFAADDARRRLDSEEVTFDELIAERGVVISDITLGTVTRDDLPKVIADAVFTIETTDVVGPLESELGPALYRINAVLGADFTSFEDALVDLSTELANQDAITQIADGVTGLEDLLASGATIEEIVAESNLILEKIAFEQGITNNGLAAYSEFRNAVLEAEEGDFPELLELGGDGLFTFRLDELVTPKLQPFEEVRDAVVAAWERQQLSLALEEQADNLAAQLHNGANFEELGLTASTETELGRDGFVDGAPQSLSSVAFKTSRDDTAAFGDATEWGVLRVNEITPPDLESESTTQTIEALETRFNSGISQDVMALFSNYLRIEVGLRLNLEVIDAIHAQLP